MSFRASRPRARPVLALLRRDVLIGRSYRVAFAADLLFGLLNVAIYYFINRALGSPHPESLGTSVTYFGFAAIGVAIVSVVASASVGLARRVREEQLTGTLETLVAQPVMLGELAIGLAGYPFVMAILRAGVYIVGADLIVGLGLHDPDWLGFVLVLVASAGVLVSIGVAMAAVVVFIQRAEVILTLVAFGLGFLGGAYFPRSALPDWLEAIGAITPTRFAFDGARAALLHGSGWADDALILIAFGVVGLPLAIALFGASLRNARKRATLARY